MCKSPNTCWRHFAGSYVIGNNWNKNGRSQDFFVKIGSVSFQMATLYVKCHIKYSTNRCILISKHIYFESICWENLEDIEIGLLGSQLYNHVYLLYTEVSVMNVFDATTFYDATLCNLTEIFVFVGWDNRITFLMEGRKMNSLYWDVYKYSSKKFGRRVRYTGPKTGIEDRFSTSSRFGYK